MRKCPYRADIWRLARHEVVGTGLLGLEDKSRVGAASAPARDGWAGDGTAVLDLAALGLPVLGLPVPPAMNKGL